MENIYEGFEPKGTKKANKDARKEISLWLTDRPNARQKEILAAFEKLYGAFPERRESAASTDTERSPEMIRRYLKKLEERIESWKTEVTFLYSDSLNPVARTKNAKDILTEIMNMEGNDNPYWLSIEHKCSDRDRERYNELKSVLEFLKNLLSELAANEQGKRYGSHDDVE